MCVPRAVVTAQRVCKDSCMLGAMQGPPPPKNHGSKKVSSHFASAFADAAGARGAGGGGGGGGWLGCLGCRLGAREGTGPRDEDALGDEKAS